jgi:tRNA pseudouridine55 synthase
MGRRGATTLLGVLPLDKPSGMTSHDVVAAVRKATGEGRVGHAGTLDPMATGLLVVLIGRYTRLEPYLSGARKTYEARIAFGSATDTDDAEGDAVDVAPVRASVLDPDTAQTALDALLGDSMQQPPAYSAIKVGGRVAHRAARAGETLDVEPRPITVDVAELLRVDVDARTWDVRFRVSKGTYVRALARDLGRAMGTFAHLAALRRTTAGALTLDDAYPLDEAVAAASEERIESLFADPVAALGLPTWDASARDVANGRRLAAGDACALPEQALAAVLVGGRLHGVYRREGDALVPEAVVGEEGTA